jgi:hypothetical protein
MDSGIDGGGFGIGAKLLTKKQAAAFFGIHYRTLERWHNLRYIDYVRIRGRIFVSYAEIDRICGQFLDTKPNGNHMDSRIRSVDDIHRRQQQQHYCYGARR